MPTGIQSYNQRSEAFKVKDEVKNEMNRWCLSKTLQIDNLTFMY